MVPREHWSVPGRPAKARSRFLVLAAAAVLISPLLWLNAFEGAREFANDIWITILVCVIPACAAAACFARSTVSKLDRLAWRLIAIGIACWAAGAIFRFLFMVETDGRPVPAPADPLFMATYPFLFAGLVLVLRNRLRSYRHLAIYDAVTGFVLLVVLAFTFFPGPITDITAREGDVATVVLAFYPLGDIALLIMLASLFRFTGRPGESPWLLFAAGLTLFAVADLIFALAVPTFGTGLSLLYALWLFGFLLIIAGSWQPDGDVLEVDPGVIQLVPPVLFLTLALAGLLHGQSNDIWTSAIVGLTIVVVLVLLRIAITAREFSRKSQATSAHLFDSLTGLPSRNRLEDILADLSGTPAWRSQPVFVMVVALERVGQIERALGSKAVDDLISAMATRVRRTAGDVGIVGVIGRAEFGVICSQESAPDPAKLVETVRQAFEPSAKIGGVRLQLNCVIGLAAYPEDTSDPNDLIRLALVSRAEAREAEEAFRLAPTRPELDKRNLRLLEELRHALRADEICLHFQPKISTTDGRVRAAEALVRWEHPDHGLMSPAEFVALAQENGLGPMLTERVFFLALEAKNHWESLGIELDVAVNLGMADLIDESLPDRLRQALTLTGSTTENLTLELSENLVAGKSGPLSENLRRLKEEGYRISLDDFGAGATSLAHMRELPLDEIKIDRSLIVGMHRSHEDAVIGQSAVLIAKQLGLNVVAEGAEERSTVQLLVELDCGEIQSFFFARPMDAKLFVPWLSSYRADLAAITV